MIPRTVRALAMAAVVVTVAAFGAGCGKSHDATQASSGTSPASELPVEEPPPDDADEAPVDLDCGLLSGAEVSADMQLSSLGDAIPQESGYLQSSACGYELPPDAATVLSPDPGSEGLTPKLDVELHTYAEAHSIDVHAIGGPLRSYSVTSSDYVMTTLRDAVLAATTTSEDQFEDFSTPGVGAFCDSHISCFVAFHDGWAWITLIGIHGTPTANTGMLAVAADAAAAAGLE